jgi:hypothetical protein
MDSLSPYYLTATDDEDRVVQTVERSIVFSPASRASIPFELVSENLDRAYNTNRQDDKENIAFHLLQEALHTSSENPLSEVVALLRVCLPLYDNRSVYGFKTHKLLKSFAKAFLKSGDYAGKRASDSLLEWMKCPVAVKMKNSVICMPEIAVAHAHSIRFPNQRERERLTLSEVAALCQRLTNMYKEKHKEMVMATTGDGKTQITAIKVDKIVEVLCEILPRLNFLECKILVRVLLRSVTLGFGVKTFMGSFFGRALQNRLDHQMDLCRTGMAIVNMSSTNKEKEADALKKQVLCGVPFRSMTCEVTSSPYVMKWLFSKEESIKNYLPPKDGRLIIHSNGKWFVPAKATKRHLFVELEDMNDKPKIKHMQILKEIKRNKALFVNEEAAYGKVISYIISKEREYNRFTVLIRGMKEISGEELAREGLALDESEEEGDVDQFVLSTEAHPITVRGTTIYISLCTNLPEPSKKVRQSEGLIVQRKYDGDRLQAHLAQTHDGKAKVQLFSKSGKPVHHLYSDIAKEFTAKISRNITAELPCILDGEIIVVGPDQKPLPWSSTKWRYDSGRGGESLDALEAGGDSVHSTIISLVDETSYGETHADGEDSDITLAPLASLKVWDGVGASEKSKIRGKILTGAKLLYVVFDMIMVRGKNITEQPYSERLKQIKALKILSGLKYSEVIKETGTVTNARELGEELEKSVRDKAEGLIIKDPRASYVHGKSNTQRKLKICGPDINCVVIGFGFTLSKNPRMWGILTAILSDDKKELLVYNRVESIEGDSPSTAAEHILALPSCIPVDTLKCNARREIDTGKYIVTVEGVRVSWRGKEEETCNCSIYFPHGFPPDIQWLCNPYECLFGLSQRGDLHPLEWKNADSVTVWIPRFPVGRIELNELQRSECDTPSTIMAKFNEACDEPTCIHKFLKRRVSLLRSKPPKVEKLEELRRILLGEKNQSETWPQIPDVKYSLEDFSTLLSQHGFETLTQGERQVLCGLPPRSQWEHMLTKNIKIIDSEAELTSKNEMEANLPSLAERFRKLKEIRKKNELRHPITRTQMPESEKLNPEAGTNENVFTIPFVSSDLPHADTDEECNSSTDEDIPTKNIYVTDF